MPRSKAKPAKQPVDPALSAKRAAAARLGHAQKMMRKASGLDSPQPVETATQAPIITDELKPRLHKKDAKVSTKALTKTTSNNVGEAKARSVGYIHKTRTYAAENSLPIVIRLVHDATTLDSARDRIAAARLVFEVAGLVGAGAVVSKQAPGGDDLREYSADQIRDLIAKSVEREQSLIAQSDLISDAETVETGVNSGIQGDNVSDNAGLGELSTGFEIPPDDAELSTLSPDADTPTHPPGDAASIIIPDPPPKISTP